MKKGKKYILKKKTGNSPKDLKSPEATINEIMETITTNGNGTNSKESTHESTNEENLLNIFEQYSNFSHPTSD